MKTFHPHARRRRAQGALIGLGLALSLLLGAFFRVQVLGSTTWTLRAESNRLRQLPLPAPRGTIYDRDGTLLADNVPGYAVTLLPGPPDSIRATLERMSRYVELSPARIDRLVSDLRRYGRELVVDADADFEVVSALEERRSEFPDVFIEMRPRRRYLGGAATSHVLGYVGEITAEELASEDYADARYEQRMVVGKTGIEDQYETRLQGERGLRYVEVDARGRIVGDFAGVTADPAEPGQDLYLNLDLELQRFIHSIFPDSMAGAVVALDPADGGVLALYSAPSFDANAFVGGIDSDFYSDLLTDPQKPLYNRAVLGLYAPASTWKLASAAIGLDLGVIAPEETMPVPCTGSWYWGNRLWRCHRPEGHGYNNLAQAIGNSCDVYFYQLGLRITLDRMLERATDIGFSNRCGIDLPQESRGTFPADRAFWNRRFGYSPQEGEVLSLAIGQGPNDQTPLKMAQFYVALARDGSAPAPLIAKGVPIGEGWSLNLSSEHLASLREGLRTVTRPGGTAHFAGTLEHWEVLGKTGTGQNALSMQGLAGNHAWFAAIVGPFDGGPEVVVVSLVEHGESGSRVAAPLATKTADFYLRKKHGIPQDSVQTLGEWLQTRGVAGMVPAAVLGRIMIRLFERWAVDPALVLAILVLSLFGVAIIYSAGVVYIPNAVTQDAWLRQSAWLVIALGAFTVLSRVPLRWIEWVAIPSYVLSLVLLAATLVIGTGAGTSVGVKSFINFGPIRFQPAEVAKIATVLLLARMLSQRTEGLASLRDILAPATLVALPLGLVMLQPDLGTAMAFVGILFAMLYWAGTPVALLLLVASPVLGLILSFDTQIWSWYIVAVVAFLYFYRYRLFLFESVTVVMANLAAGTIARPLWNSLRAYQQNRILVFLDPEVDPRGAGYQIIQSKVAIGSGGLLGKGFTLGTQKRFDFLPEQHTDFIFSVVGEELGFLGTALAILAFGFVLSRLIHMAQDSPDPFAGLVLIGIFGAWLVHIFVNIGMTVGLVPITGIPLPFVSYGGTFLLMSWVAVAIAVRVAHER